MDEYERLQFIEDTVHKLMEHHENTHVLDLGDEKLLTTGAKIRIASDDGNWLEIELLDTKGKVRLTSGEMFVMSGNTVRANQQHEATPIVGQIIGSLKNAGPLPSEYDDVTVLDGTRLNSSVPIDASEVLPLQVKHWHVLIYQVGEERRVLNGAMAVTITFASGKTFDLWQ